MNVPATRVEARISTVRQQFDQGAARLRQHDALLQVVQARLIERLQGMRPPSSRILDLGCGAARSRLALLERFPQAQWLGVDLSCAMLRSGEEPRPWWACFGARHSPPWRVCADAAQLPLAEASVDIVHSNLMLHWHPAPHAVVAEIARVLRPGGLVLFSSWGPDTLAELRAAAEQALPAARPMPFVDMHDLGDMLVASGFEAPVMEAEVLRLQFASARDLLREARALGGNPRSDRPGALPSGRRARDLLARLQARANAQGRIELRFEVVYGHGWRAAPRRPGVATIAAPRSRRAGPA